MCYPLQLSAKPLWTPKGVLIKDTDCIPHCSLKKLHIVIGTIFNTPSA